MQKTIFKITKKNVRKKRKMKITNNEQIGNQSIQSMINLTSMNGDIRKEQIRDFETQREKNKRIEEEILKEIEK